MKENEVVSKRICAVEVLNQAKLARLSAILLVVMTFVVYGVSMLDYYLGMSAVAGALAVSTYFIYKTDKLINYLRSKYAI